MNGGVAAVLPSPRHATRLMYDDHRSEAPPGAGSSRPPCSAAENAAVGESATRRQADEQQDAGAAGEPGEHAEVVERE